MLIFTEFLFNFYMHRKIKWNNMMRYVHTHKKVRVNYKPTWTSSQSSWANKHWENFKHHTQTHQNLLILCRKYLEIYLKAAFYLLEDNKWSKLLMKTIDTKYIDSIQTSYYYYGVIRNRRFSMKTSLTKKRNWKSDITK